VSAFTLMSHQAGNNLRTICARVGHIHNLNFTAISNGQQVLALKFLRLNNSHGIYTQRGIETFIFVNLFSFDVLTLIHDSEVSAEFTLLPNHHALGIIRRIIQEATRHVFQIVLLVGILSFLQIDKIKPLEVTIMRGEH
jgi:hypothetical protein